MRGSLLWGWAMIILIFAVIISASGLAWGAPNGEAIFPAIAIKPTLRGSVFPGTGGSWAGGGLTFVEGINGKPSTIWENARRSGTFYHRTMQGAYIGTVTYRIPGNKGVDLTWDNKRHCWYLTDPFGGLIHKIEYDGAVGKSYVYDKYWISGIYYHSRTDRIWIGSNFKGGFSECTPHLKLIKRVNLPYGIQGIVRVGEYLWVGGPVNKISQLRLNGQATGKQFELPENFMAQSITYDGQNLLVRAQPREGQPGKPMIYRFDLGFPPPAPTPDPAFTPIAMSTPSPTLSPATSPTPLRHYEPSPADDLNFFEMILEFLGKIFGFGWL